MSAPVRTEARGMYTQLCRWPECSLVAEKVVRWGVRPEQIALCTRHASRFHTLSRSEFTAMDFQPQRDIFVSQSESNPRHPPRSEDRVPW